MFKEKYKKYNEHIMPSEKLVNDTLEKANISKKMSYFPINGKGVVIAICMFAMLGVTAITIDAATGGAISKKLGLDNITIYDDVNENHTVYQNDEGQYFLQAGEKGSEGSWTLMINPNNRILTIDIVINDNKRYAWSTEFQDYMTGEDISWEIYQGLTDCLGNQGNMEVIIEKLQECVNNMEDEYYKTGINMVIDDFKKCEDNVIIDYLVDYYDEEEKIEKVAMSWIKINRDEIKYDENGVSQVFEVASVAGKEMNFKVVFDNEFGKGCFEVTPVE